MCIRDSNDTEPGYDYPARVRWSLAQDDLKTYQEAADFLNFNNCLLYTSGQNRTHQQPKKARRKPELRRQCRPHQRTCSRDRREVMSEEHPSWRRNIVCLLYTSRCV